MENACGDWFPVILKCKALRDTRGIPRFLREEGNIVYWNLNGYSDLSVEEGIVEGRGIMGG